MIKTAGMGLDDVIFEPFVLGNWEVQLHFSETWTGAGGGECWGFHSSILLP